MHYSFSFDRETSVISVISVSNNKHVFAYADLKMVELKRKSKIS